MPTMEPIVSTVLPKAVEKPIPTRTVSTRVQPRPNVDQHSNSVEIPAADSATPAESVRLSPQITALARKEQAFRQREQALKERERALEAKLADADQYSQLKTKFASKDYSAAEELGLTYDEHLKYALDKQEGEDPGTKRFKDLEAQIQALKTGQEEKASKEYEETVAEYKKEIAQLVASSADFPLTKKAKKEDAVLQLILDSWEEDSTEMTVEQASKDVETYLKEQRKAWLALDDQPQAETVETKLSPPKPGTRTITQQMQPSGTEKRPQKSFQHMSESERYAEARRRVLERQQLEGNR